MGGRGAFYKSGGSGIAKEYREYSTISQIGRIKVVIWEAGKNNATINFSNTPNTTYYSCSKERMRIEKIYFYRNHRLYKSIDLDIDKGTPHVHYWKEGKSVGRKSHDPNNVFQLSGRDARLVRQAQEWNDKHKNDTALWKKTKKTKARS